MTVHFAYIFDYIYLCDSMNLNKNKIAGNIAT